MKLISEHDIDRVLEELRGNRKEPLKYIVNAMHKAQPAVYEYLMSVEEDELNFDERNLMLNFVSIGWHVIKETIGDGGIIDEESLDARLAINIDLIEEMDADDNEPEFDLISLIIDNSEQPVLMGFLINLVVDRPEDFSATVRDEVLLVILLHIKTVLDCLLFSEMDYGYEGDSDDYSDETRAVVRGQIADMYVLFKKSRFYMKLDFAQKENAETIITDFGDYMYVYFLLMPSDWTVLHAAECCTEIMPAKAADDAGYFTSIVPVLTSFMAFSAERGGIINAERIAERIAGIGDIIVKRADNGKKRKKK